MTPRDLELVTAIMSMKAARVQNRGLEMSLFDELSRPVRDLWNDRGTPAVIELLRNNS